MIRPKIKFGLMSENLAEFYSRRSSRNYIFDQIQIAKGELELIKNFQKY